ncbi:hypothetical protein Aperf_G00000016559 [Anoplocephala perfoliata]
MTLEMSSDQLQEDPTNVSSSDNVPYHNHKNGPYASSCLLRIPHLFLPEIFQAVPKALNEVKEKSETANRKEVPDPRHFFPQSIRDILCLYADEASERSKDEFQFTAPNQNLLDSNVCKTILDGVDENRLNRTNSVEGHTKVRMSRKYGNGTSKILDQGITGDDLTSEEFSDGTEIFDSVNDESACECEICSQMKSSGQSRNIKNSTIKNSQTSPEEDNAEPNSKGSIKDDATSAHSYLQKPEFNHYFMMARFSGNDNRKELKKMAKSVEECKMNETDIKSVENVGVELAKDSVSYKNDLGLKVRFDENVSKLKYMLMHLIWMDMAKIILPQQEEKKVREQIVKITQQQAKFHIHHGIYMMAAISIEEF